MGERSQVAARRGVFPLAMVVFSAIGLEAWGQAPDESRPPTSLLDLRLAEVRKASVGWDSRRGPTRKVVNQVVLVSDFGEFCEAIAGWDESHWFPILWEDAEFTPRFLRAFRPARVVRLHAPLDPARAEFSWETAAWAVEQAWSGGEAEAAFHPPPPRPDERPNAVMVPRRLGKTPPGMVLTAPDSSSLAASVALAAGRFQPMVPWTGKKSPVGTVLNEEEAGTLADEVEQAVNAVVPRHGSLGDDCDFLTVAVDLPDRYHMAGGTRHGQSAAGIASLDDRLGRDRNSKKRWAFVGRIDGDPGATVYRAMCSLFLQPRTVLLFDAYDENRDGFSTYVMKPAMTRLGRLLDCQIVQGKDADLAGWHRAFGRKNTHDLVYVNSSGGANFFNLKGGKAGTVVDIPPSVPAIVLLNHSYSAAEPRDVDTIAGRWLANGAFLYFGSMNEPYLQSFRTPRLLADLLTEGVPISACVRMVPEENGSWGIPWRLTLLGDPLYRVERLSARASRLDTWGDPDTWKLIENAEKPPKTDGGDELLEWCRKATLLEAIEGEARPVGKALEEGLLAIVRPNLRPGRRSLYDGLLIDALFRPSPRTGEILGRLAEIGPNDRSPAVTRALATARASDSNLEPGR